MWLWFCVEVHINWSAHFSQPGTHLRTHPTLVSVFFQVSHHLMVMRSGIALYSTQWWCHSCPPTKAGTNLTPSCGETVTCSTIAQYFHPKISFTSFECTAVYEPGFPVQFCHVLNHAILGWLHKTTNGKLLFSPFITREINVRLSCYCWHYTSDKPGETSVWNISEDGVALIADLHL